MGDDIRFVLVDTLGREVIGSHLALKELFGDHYNTSFILWVKRGSGIPTPKITLCDSRGDETVYKIYRVLNGRRIEDPLTAEDYRRLAN